MLKHVCFMWKFLCRSNLKPSTCDYQTLGKTVANDHVCQFCIFPKNIVNQSISRGITRCQRLSARSYTTFVGTRNDRELSEGKCGPCTRVIAFLTVLRKQFYASWWLWNIVDCCCPHHLSANEMRLCMIMLVIIWSKLLVISLIKLTFQMVGTTRSSQRFRSKW
jgi:hypothetical protein